MNWFLKVILLKPSFTAVIQTKMNTSRIASSVLMNCYQWKPCIPCQISTKEPMELTVITNFKHWRPNQRKKREKRSNSMKKSHTESIESHFHFHENYEIMKIFFLKLKRFSCKWKYNINIFIIKRKMNKIYKKIIVTHQNLRTNKIKNKIIFNFTKLINIYKYFKTKIREL